MIPKLRFPEFSGEWEAKKLGGLLKLVVDNRGKTPPVSDSGIPLIEVNAIGDKDIEYSAVSKYVNQTTYDTWFRKHLDDGDVLFSTVGQTALTSQYKSSQLGTIAQNIVGLRASGDIDGTFLYYLLTEDRNNHQFKKIEMVAVQPSVKVSQMIHLRFKLPSKREQEKIAGFLTAVDGRIAAMDKKVELLQQYKKGVMQKIFSQKLRFKDEGGNDYPDWQAKKLSDVFNEVTSKVGDREVKTYSITAGNGFISQAEKFGKDISGDQNSRYTYLSENEFSYNKGNSKTYKFGCVYVNHEGESIAVPNVFISFRLAGSGVVGYFEQLFINHYLDKYLRQIISSGARMDGLLNVSKTDFFGIQLPVPDEEEQQKIADFLTSLDDKMNLEKTKLERAKLFKKSLLQRMFV